MRQYSYKAKDSKTGKAVKGVVQAETERAAGKLLMEQGYVPESLKEEDDSGWLSKLQGKISSKEKIVFFRQFATLIGAGLPLAGSLRTVAQQTDGKAMRSVLLDVLASVEAGKSLYESCKVHPDVFDHVCLSLIEAGEMSGTLDTALKRLAAQKEKDEAMMSKIRSAMTYPAIVLVVIIVVVIFMLVQVVPQVESLYNDMGETLPVATQILVHLANFLMAQWYVVVAVLTVGVWFFLQFRKTDLGTRWIDTFKLNVPMFSGLFLRLYNARFARTMQIMLMTGVSMLDSLDISITSVNNVVVAEQLNKAKNKVQSGQALSAGLNDLDYLMPLVPQMAAIGEESGKIDEMLGKAAQVYEDELDEKIAAISTMIEPILMVVMALLCGGIVLAVLMPIYSLVSSM